MNDFDKVKSYLSELGMPISREDADEQLVVVDDESQGLQNLVIDCEAPILILEQLVLVLPATDEKVLKRLLQLNRTLVHGAFAVDDGGEKVIFRDTLQLENLDLNELEASINALSLALAENSAELLSFANR